jgi:serine/threonine-protein kinase
MMGTLRYLSPEAARGESPDPSFDLWSLAVVLFEALTGMNPVARETALDTMLAIREAKIADAREWRPDCPPGLAAFLCSALARDRAARPSSARELRLQLTEAVRTAVV